MASLTNAPRNPRINGKVLRKNALDDDDQVNSPNDGSLVWNRDDRVPSPAGGPPLRQGVFSPGVHSGDDGGIEVGNGAKAAGRSPVDTSVARDQNYPSLVWNGANRESVGAVGEVPQGGLNCGVSSGDSEVTAAGKGTSAVVGPSAPATFADIPTLADYLVNGWHAWFGNHYSTPDTPIPN